MRATLFLLAGLVSHSGGQFFILPPGLCTEEATCPECAGHCVGDRVCAGDLKCSHKEDAGVVIPGCAQPDGGVDESFTDWCIDMPVDTRETIPLLPLRLEGCSEEDPCYRCEGPCYNDRSCRDGYLCSQKGGPLAPVPGCSGIDGSLTEWCVAMPVDDREFIPRNLVTGGCSVESPCFRCEGHCEDDSVCASGLECYTKPAGRGLVPGCIGADESETSWCIIPGAVEPPTGTPSTSLTPSALPTESGAPSAVPSTSLVPSVKASDVPSVIASEAPSDTHMPSAMPSGSPTPEPTDAPVTNPPSASVTMSGRPAVLVASFAVLMTTLGF